MSGKNVNHCNIPTEIEMVLVSETQPVERFKKLIAKGHLEEAEVSWQIHVQIVKFSDLILRILAYNLSWICSQFMKPKQSE